MATKTLCVSTRNRHKLQELGALLHDLPLSLMTAEAAGVPHVDETGTTFADNAILKAHAAAAASQLPVLADDSGLAVSALGGAPGIHSARWAGPGRDFQAAMERVEEALKDHSDRTARFVCALVLAWPDGGLEVFEGEVAGALVWPPRGSNGFGYDPMFVADGMHETFGELEPKVKLAITHRSRAFAKLAANCLPNTGRRGSDPE